MKSNVVLILSGYNNRAVIAFCRFCKKYDISFYIVASGKDDTILQTTYTSNIIETRKSKNLSLDDFVDYKNKIIEKETLKDIVVLPTTEFLNRFLLTSRKDLESYGFIIPLTNIDLYEKISDKYSFCELCENHGINIPKEYEAVDESHIPFVAKPKSYFINGLTTSEKPILIMNEDDYNLFTLKKNKEEFYYQEFVGGGSFYLLYYFSKDRSYSVYSQQNFIQQDDGLSIVGAKSSDFHKRKVEGQYAELFLNQRFEGVLMVEVKEYNDKTYMIEANPRLWGPSQLILDADMDLFHRFACDFNLIAKGRKHVFSYKEGITYFWSGGICQDLENGKKPVFHQYNEDMFFNEYHNWIKNDVYLKKDTLSIYLNETKN